MKHAMRVWRRSPVCRSGVEVGYVRVRLGKGITVQETRISTAHLALSDTYMSDAATGLLSPRGSADSAFDAGYFALLSVLTEDERAAMQHPSEQAVVLASQRLGLDPRRGLALACTRYSAEEWPEPGEVIAWADSVRAQARRFEIR